MEKIKGHNKIAVFGIALLSLWSLAISVIAIYVAYAKSNFNRIEYLEASNLFNAAFGVGLLVSFIAVLLSFVSFLCRPREDASTLLILGVLTLVITFYRMASQILS